MRYSEVGCMLRWKPQWMFCTYICNRCWKWPPQACDRGCVWCRFKCKSQWTCGIYCYSKRWKWCAWACNGGHIFHLKGFMYGTVPLPAQCSTPLVHVHWDILLTLYNNLNVWFKCWHSYLAQSAVLTCIDEFLKLILWCNTSFICYGSWTLPVRIDLL